MPSMSACSEPRLAVVICTRDRPAALEETLLSVWKQTRPPDEFILIDDGCLPDSLIENTASQCGRLGIGWRFAKAVRPGLTACRNQAADLAESGVLQYLDDDVTLAPDFLEHVARLMRDPLITAVTAAVREPTLSGRSARLYQWGYRFAGWWKVRPRSRPAGPPPAILGQPAIATPAVWLSGAAMAIRRDIVRAYRFNEELVEYALGEDREMGYRLAPRYWLVVARQAAVIHRREPGRRTGSRRLGFMTTYNYLRILRETCRLGLGDWLLIVWSFFVLGIMHIAWAIFGGSRRGHLEELHGMWEGLLAFLRLSPAPRPTDRFTETTTPSGTVSTRSRTSRALFITNRLEAGGAERMLLALVQRLGNYGVQPVVACLKDEGPWAEKCRASDVTVFDRLLRHKADIGVLLRLRRIVRQERINKIVVAHSGGDRMFWGTLAGWLTGVPVVVWSHWFPRAGQRHFERLNRLLVRSVETYIALGHRHRSALSHYEYVPASRIAVIPNAIETEPFRHSSRTEAREQLGLSPDELAVVLVANLRREKRHDIFIEAARRLFSRLTNVRFFIIGNGPDYTQIQSYVATAGLPADKLRLLGQRDDIAALLAGFDISCLCSEVECFSVTMLEAAAAGCAFIGPDTGCLPEFLEHCQTGFMIKPADANDLTDAIEALATDPQLRRRLTDAARERLDRSFNIEALAQAFAALLR